MLSVFQASLSPMLVMLLCIIAGFVLSKAHILPSNAASVISKLETYILVPCVYLLNFMQYCTVASLAEKYDLVLYCILIVGIAIALAYALAGLFTKEAYQKNIYRYALTFGNCGFLGNAIVPQILGDAALYTYLLFTLPLNFLISTWGITILTPKKENAKSPFAGLLNPTVVAVLIGIVLGITGAGKHLPSFFHTAVSNLAACMGPLAMVLTGVVIGNYNIPKLLSNKKVYIATGLRLFILPALFIGLLMLIGASKEVMTLCLFAFATPLGLNTVVYPAAFGGDTSTGASMAMVSHTLSILTIPVMYALLSLIVQ